MKHAKKAISCLIALVLLMPSANAFAQESSPYPVPGAAQTQPQQGTDVADGGSQYTGTPAGDSSQCATTHEDGGSQDASVPAVDGAMGASSGQGEAVAAGSPDAAGSKDAAGGHDAASGLATQDAQVAGNAHKDDALEANSLGVAIAPYDQSGATGAAIRPATTEQIQFELHKGSSSTEWFRVKTDSGMNPGGGDPLYGKHYEWWIDWGDGTPAGIYTDTNSPDGFPSPNRFNSSISHGYNGTPGDVYILTIMPAGSTDAWLGSFGGFSELALQGMSIDILSPLTPLMTRSAAQIADPGAVQPSYEWNWTFSNLSNLVSTGPGFDPAWSTVTKAGDCFAYAMFYGSKPAYMMPSFNLPQGFTSVGDDFAFTMFFDCRAASFTMNDVFNLPAGITAVGDSFAGSMFGFCSGSSFTMNDVFNLPAGITSTGKNFASSLFNNCGGPVFTMNDVFNLPVGITHASDYFASGLFSSCSGDVFTMNDVFNLPQGITSVGKGFASSMFSGCWGAVFNMNSAYNLPAGIISTGDSFANDMFRGCFGDAFTMNDVFNLPTGITSAGYCFAMKMFYACRGASFTMNDVFNLPQGITSVGDYFVNEMFIGCGGAAFNMNDIFTMPQGIMSAGDSFAQGMFQYCDSPVFTMNDVFNLPQGITSVGDCFADSMFFMCSGDAFTMNDAFNLPAGITATGNLFADSMFRHCYGQSFTMNSVFNMPQGITAARDSFASAMFFDCRGASFTMNDVFNLPQGITSVDDSFVYAMFSGCSGTAFQVNDTFTFPRLPQAELDRSGAVGGVAFRETFQGLNTSVKQKRSAVSIINNPNGNPMTAPYYTLYPANAQGTFDAAFVDLPLIHPNWGGIGQTADCVVSFDANGFAGISFPSGVDVFCQQGGLVSTPVMQLAAGCRLLGWYRDAACTQAWDLATDVIPAGTTSMTLYAKGIAPLVFVDLGFDVPASTVGTAIAPISTAPGVSGGLQPYAFSAAGLPAGLVIDPATGEVAGTPTAEGPAGTAVITVTDALGQTASISISIGEVSKVSGNTGGNGGGNGGGTGGGNGGGSGGGNGSGSGNGNTGGGSNGGTPNAKTGGGAGGGTGGGVPGKGNTTGGMVKTGDSLGFVATGAVATGLAALLALVALALVAVRRAARSRIASPIVTVLRHCRCKTVTRIFPPLVLVKK